MAAFRTYGRVLDTGHVKTEKSAAALHCVGIADWMLAGLCENALDVGLLARLALRGENRCPLSKVATT